MGEYIIHNGMIYSKDELCHYGVRGMKWGVRKSSTLKKQYRADKRIRRQLELEAHDYGQFSKKYIKLYDRKTKSLEKSIAKDMDKHQQLSTKTKKKMRSMDVLKGDKDLFTSLNNHTVKSLEEHVDTMVKKYGDKKISSVRSKTYKGEKYVSTIRAKMANANVTYDLKRRSSTDAEGNDITRYEPVKTRHYYYVY